MISIMRTSVFYVSHIHNTVRTLKYRRCETKMGWTCGSKVGDKECLQIFFWDN
jgi:hypothetical protein